MITKISSSAGMLQLGKALPFENKFVPNNNSTRTVTDFTLHALQCRIEEAICKLTTCSLSELISATNQLSSAVHHLFVCCHMVNLESQALDHDNVFEEFHLVLKLLIRIIVFTKACTGIWSWDDTLDQIREVASTVGEGCNNLTSVIKSEQLLVSCILPNTSPSSTDSSTVNLEKSEYPLLELIETTNLAKEELSSLIELASNNIVNQAGDLLHVINQQSSAPLSTGQLLQLISKYCISVGQLLSIIEDIRLFKYTDSVHEEDRAERLIQFFSLKNHMYKSLLSLTAFCEEMYQSNQDSSNPHLMVLVLSVLRSSEEMASMTRNLMKNCDCDTYLITNFCSLSQRKLKDMELHNIKFRILNLFQISKDPSCNSSHCSSPLSPNFSSHSTRGFTNRLRSISTSSQTLMSPLESSYNSSLDSSELSDFNSSTVDDYVTLGIHFGKNTAKSTMDGFNLQIDTEMAQELIGPLPSLSKGLNRGDTFLKKKNYSLGKPDSNIGSPTLVTRKPTNASGYSHTSKSSSITNNLRSMITPIFKARQQVKPSTNLSDSPSSNTLKPGNKKRDVTFIMPSGRSYHPSKGFNSADSSGYIEGKLTNLIKGKYGSTNNLSSTMKNSSFETSFDDLQEVVIPLRPKRFHSNFNLNHSFQSKSPTLSSKSPILSSLSNTTSVKGKNYYQFMTPAEDVVQNKDGQITMGTLDALVERLTPHHPNLEPEPNFVNTFMLTFRSFCTPHILLNKLIDRFQLCNQSIIRDRTNQILSNNEIHIIQEKVCTILMLWLETFFFEDQDLVILDTLGKFCPELVRWNFKWEESKIMSLIKDKICKLFISQNNSNFSTSDNYHRDDDNSAANCIFFTPAPLMVPAPPPQPILTKSILSRLVDEANGSLSLLDLDPIEAARQLTILECKNFCKIKPFDLFGKDFTKSKLNPGSSCQSIKLMSQTSTNVTNMVIRHILSDQQPKMRAKTLKFYIKLADESCSLRNYNTLMAVVCGLNSTPISRLKKTWKLLSQKYHAIFDNLKTLTDTNRNYYTYRNLVKSSPIPCLPFLGLYLTDLTFTDDGNPAFRPHPMEQMDHSRSKMVNFSKCLKTFNLIKEILRFQNPYNLIEVVEIQELVQDELDINKCRRGLGSNDIDYLYHKSLRLEPKSLNI